MSKCCSWKIPNHTKRVLKIGIGKVSFRNVFYISTKCDRVNYLVISPELSQRRIIFSWKSVQVTLWKTTRQKTFNLSFNLSRFLSMQTIVIIKDVFDRGCLSSSHFLLIWTHDWSELTRWNSKPFDYYSFLDRISFQNHFLKSKDD